ncbi:unnamed protein product [Paramecium octaurelia]|uniref:H-type lectin domain-containing protein n=1 Tax=Paramecium octaurelia TaxID=43137 RepID=A0A8S1V474_PAROT|nr:unnamed protein product [Paramecium octaurelia]
MKMGLLIVMTLFICINGIQQSNGILDLQNLKAHQLFTKNVQFDQEFDEIPQVVVSIKQIIGDQFELYTRAININLRGFDLQIISSSNIANIKINYLAINDNSLNIICENYQTKKDEIKVPFNIEHSQVAAFITGLKLQQNEKVYFKLNSISDSQAVFQTKQKAMGLCLVFGDEDKIAHQQSIITSTLQDNKLEFNVENIEDSITLPLENQVLSFDDIISKLSIESKGEQSTQVQDEEEKYLDIDSIQIETLGINTIQQNIEDEVIQSVDIQFLQPENKSVQDELLKIEENHIERVQEIIGQAVDQEIQLEEQEEKKFLTQVNQVNVIDMQNIQDTIQQEIIIQEAYELVPQSVDDLDMDALYKEFTLSQQLNDDLFGQNKNIISQQQQQQSQVQQQLQQQEQQQLDQQQQQQDDQEYQSDQQYQQQNLQQQLQGDQQQQQQDQQLQQSQQQQQETLEVIESVDVVQDQLVNEVQSEIIADKTETEVEEQKPVKRQLQIDVPLFDEDLQFDDVDVELDYKKEEKEEQEVSPAQYIIDVYKSFANEEADQQNQKENEDHPFVEVSTETQTEEMQDEVVNELDGLRDGLEGVDFSLFFDEFSQPDEMNISRKSVQNQEEQQIKINQQQYEESKQFKQSKEKIEDVMKDLQITTDVTTSEDERKLITQLKQKSAELKKKLQEQYDAVPKLEQAKKQTEVSMHPITDQYPKIESDSKINYEVESKYVEWSMNQEQKIKKIGLDLTEDDLRNPRFSLLQMDQRSELDIQRQINEFLGFDDLSFIMIKQNLRGR